MVATAAASGGTRLADTDADTYIETEANAGEDHIRMYTDGTERLTIDNTGNVTVNGNFQATGTLLDSTGNPGMNEYILTTSLPVAVLCGSPAHNGGYC